MTIQKRIVDLEDYTQLESTEIGYINPSNIYLAVDNSTESWAEPKKVTFAAMIGITHMEAGQLSALSSRSVVVTFNSPFTLPVIPYINPYREVVIGGKTIREAVRIYDLAITINGFTLTIDPNEILTGAIIDYKVTQG